MSIEPTRYGVVFAKGRDAGAQAPQLSICVNTFNRAELLRLCLERLVALTGIVPSFEVVVSDNCSTDNTMSVAEEVSASFSSFTFLRMRENLGGHPNQLNAIRHARGTFVICMADDDRLVPENVARHVAVMNRRPELVATYTDWISFDDDKDVELHRYYPFLKSRREFAPSERLELINFALLNELLPEISIARRANLLKALPLVKNGYLFLQYLYLMARQGTVAFDPLPIYIENRVVQGRFGRTQWQGSLGLWLVGDELQTSLELVVLKAYQDCGFTAIPPEARVRLRHLIDKRVRMRLELEAHLAAFNRNWILASELRRRELVWQDASNALHEQSDIDRIVVPAALQAIAETFAAVSDCTRCAFRGFHTTVVADEFHKLYPDIPLESTALASSAPISDAQCLYVIKTEADLSGAQPAGNVLLFDNLVDLYKTTAFTIDLSAL